jgi:ethanolamine ammonia-lyase large subunit
VAAIPDAVCLRTRSADRRDYIWHPPSGERLDEASERMVRELRAKHAGQWEVQFLVSDGLDARSLMDEGHLKPFLTALRGELEALGWRVAPEHLVLRYGRVRAGYQVGELLFGNPGLEAPRVLVHVIGERPGSGHHAYSAYFTAPTARGWAEPGHVDHDLTRVIAGISDTSVRPESAAKEAVRIIAELTAEARTRPRGAGGAGRALG